MQTTGENVTMRGLTLETRVARCATKGELTTGRPEGPIDGKDFNQ